MDTAKVFRAIGLFVVIAIALAAGFSAGMIVDRRVGIQAAGFSIPSAGSATSSTPAPGVLNTSLIQEANQIIQQHYADRKTLQENNMTYGAISGMVDSLGDTGHSRFQSPEMVASENRQIQGEFEGIGALLNTNSDGNPVILAPMDGSPAQKAGLRPGDIIMAVNGEDVSHASLNEVVRRVLGPAGTKVTLTIRTPSTNQTRDITITRAKIIIHNVTWQMLPGTNVAHVRIASFSNNVTQDLVAVLNQAKTQGAKGILLDLRNNPGGLLDEAIGVTSEFISIGNVLQVKDAQGKVTNLQVKRGGVATDIPMVLLINEGSASAAEITAGALQDYKRADLVGQKTFGTGTVLNQYNLSDGSALLLATELWLTPKGRVIWHQGIAPDVTVTLATDASPSFPEGERDLTADGMKTLTDTQLTKALEILLAKIH